MDYKIEKRTLTDKQKQELAERQSSFEDEYKNSEMFREKILSIPYENFNDKEKEVYNKLKNHESISTDEYRLIFSYASDYDIAKSNYDAESIIENNEAFKTVIKTEKELLDFLESDEIVFKFCPSNLNNKQIELTLVTKPLSDSTIIKSIEEHEAIFQDYTAEEREVVNKNAVGGKLTRAETQILNDINKRLNDTDDNSYEARFRTIKQFIADTCYIRLPAGDIPFTLRLVNKFRFNDMISLYLKLQQILGLTEDSNRELFPDS